VAKKRLRWRGVAEKESGGRTWRTNGVGVCVYRTKMVYDIKRHKADIHNIDIVWHNCPELGCEYKAKEKGNVKVHRVAVHDIDVSGGGAWKTCGVGVCVYKTKRGSSKLKQHMAAIHSIDIVWHDCPDLGCEYRAKQKGNVKRTKPTCTTLELQVLGMNARSTTACTSRHIKQHRADVHGVGVTWQACTELGCEYKAK